MPQHKGGKKGNKKYGRNKPWCEAYRKRGQQEINQAIGLIKHLERFPDDLCALRRFGELPELAKRKAARDGLQHE
jgi:hypothetical protein